MKTVKRLRIAIQKSGRLNTDCMDLLFRCGLKINISPHSLLCHVENLPIDILFVRDDDIPTFVRDDICELGIVGKDILLEQAIDFSTVKPLGFSRCRLSIAVPEYNLYTHIAALHNLRIATSYPNLLTNYLNVPQNRSNNYTSFRLC